MNVPQQSSGGSPGCGRHCDRRRKSSLIRVSRTVEEKRRIVCVMTLRYHVKETLAKRVAHRCSRSECRQVTSGPQEDPERVINVGVAAHITAASPGGPRYDDSLTSERRQSIENGVWLCQTCAKLVDNDPLRYTCEVLHEWKRQAEKTARYELEQRIAPQDHSVTIFKKTRN